MKKVRCPNPDCGKLHMVQAEASSITPHGKEYYWPKMTCAGDGGCLRAFEYDGDPKQTRTRPTS